MNGANRGVVSPRSTGAPGYLRVGDSERDAVAVALHDHFAQGRLSRAELDERLDSALSAKTHGDLREIVRDLPGANGLPEPARTGQGPWSGAWPGPWAGPVGGPWAGPPWARHGRAHRGRPGPPAAPLLLLIFLVVAIAVNPGIAVLAVLQAAFLVWLLRAALLLRRGRT